VVIVFFVAGFFSWKKAYLIFLCDKAMQNSIFLEIGQRGFSNSLLTGKQTTYEVTWKTQVTGKHSCIHFFSHLWLIFKGLKSMNMKGQLVF